MAGTAAMAGTPPASSTGGRSSQLATPHSLGPGPRALSWRTLLGGARSAPDKQCLAPPAATSRPARRVTRRTSSRPAIRWPRQIGLDLILDGLARAAGLPRAR